MREGELKLEAPATPIAGTEKKREPLWINNAKSRFPNLCSYSLIKKEFRGLTSHLFLCQFSRTSTTTSLDTCPASLLHKMQDPTKNSSDHHQQLTGCSPNSNSNLYFLNFHQHLLKKKKITLHKPIYNAFCESLDNAYVIHVVKGNWLELEDLSQSYF